jgi:hypothetical protein
MPSRTDDPSASPRALALEYISQPCFHKRFSLPHPEPNHDDLTVTYADLGVTADHVPAFLFMPGMFGSRYMGVHIHAMAQKLGVRVLIVDRYIPLFYIVSMHR